MLELLAGLCYIGAALFGCDSDNGCYYDDCEPDYTNVDAFRNYHKSNYYNPYTGGWDEDSDQD